MNDSSDSDIPKPEKIKKFWSFIKSLKKRRAFEITSRRENGFLRQTLRKKLFLHFHQTFVIIRCLRYCATSVQCVLRWVFTLFGAILANSNLYKKTLFKETPTKAIYQYEKCLFCNTSKLLFNRRIISIL